MNEELLIEGVARELVRTVQDARKQSGLEISDRIKLRVHGTSRVTKSLAAYRDYLMSETLAIEWGDDNFEGEHSVEKSLDEDNWTIQMSKL